MRRLAPVLALTLLPLVGCSSDDGGGGDSGPSLEDRRETFVDAAEQVCTDANAEVTAIPAPTSVDTVAPYAEQVVAVLQRTVDEVAALEPPEEDQAELQEKVLGPLESDVGVAEQYAADVTAAAEANDQAGLLRLVQELPQTSADVEFMREYGLVECAKAADTGS